jgi:hypothetical protein
MTSIELYNCVTFAAYFVAGLQASRIIYDPAARPMDRLIAYWALNIAVVLATLSLTR